MADKPTVATPSMDFKPMMKAWKLPDTLMGGTPAMREAGKDFLPKNPAETPQEYDARLKRTTLFNGFRRTVKVLAAKPVATPPVVEGDNIAKVIKEVAQDPDLTGRGLTAFTRQMMIDLMWRGKTHLLVEHPSMQERLNRKQERDAGIRPYFVRIDGASLFAWRGQMIGGQEVLDQIRYKSTTVEEDGEWGEKEVTRIIVWTRDAVYRYIDISKDNEEERWELETESANTLGHIPLVTVYANQTGFMTAETPLEDLAYLNLEHWQSKSDQRNILHVARVPILHFEGFSKDQVVGQAEIGPFNAFFGKAGSSIKYVEHTGKAIESGEKDLEKLEDQMRVMGADLLVERPGNETATARALDSAEKVSDLQAITINAEDGLHEAFDLAAEWARQEPGEFSVSLNQKFGLSLRDQAVKEYLLKARAIGDITRQTFLEESKRNGFLVDDLDVQDEIDRLEQESAGRGGLELGDPDDNIEQ